MPRFLLSHARLVPCLVGWLVRSATAAAALTNRQSAIRATTSTTRLFRAASLYTQPPQDNNHHHDNDSTIALSPLAQHVQGVIQKEILPAVSSSSENSNRLSASDCHLHWIVGVSGGCDSVALLSVLLELPCCCHNNLQVVHFDHEQRGTESDADCRLVQDWCRRANVPCQTFPWSDDHDHAAAFSQETARDWRRAGMRRVGQEALAAAASNSSTSNSVGLLVTAHHKDDSEETLLLKVLRGTHLMHLKGLEMVVSDCHNLFWVRPLLHVRKAALEAHVKDGQLAWRQDASNASPKYLRNRVRNELVPLLQDLVGGEVALERRIEAMVQQSAEIHQDVEPRVSSRLPHHVADQGRVFLLSPLPSGGGDGDDHSLATTTSGLLDWLGQQALYQWIVTQAPLLMGSHGDDHDDDDNDNDDGHDHDDTHRVTLSQDVWTRVVGQLEKYPNRREWRINLGGGLDLVRTGMALRLEGPSGSGGGSKGTLLCEQEQESKVSWRIKEDDEPLLEKDDKDDLVLLLPRVWVDQWSDASTQDTRGMILSTASKHAHLTVTPPWRKGRTPIRVLEFLRGQKVPLHQRGTAALLLLPNIEGDVVVLAVHVPTKDKWVIDAAFAVAASREVGSDHVLVGVSKAKLCDRL